MYDCSKVAKSLTMRSLNVMIISITIQSPTASRDGSHGLCPKSWSWVDGFIIGMYRRNSFGRGGRRNDGKSAGIQHGNGRCCGGGLELEEAMTGVVGRSDDGLADLWNVLAFVIGSHGRLTCTSSFKE